jgi:hypothetical protein
MPCPGTWSHLNVEIGSTPEVAETFTINLNKNLAPSPLQCVIANPATQGSDLINSTPVVAGDTVALHTEGSHHDVVGRTMRHCLIFEPTTEGMQPFFGIWMGNHAEVQYGALGGYYDNAEAQAQTIVPIPGKFKFFYTKLAFGGVVGVGNTCTITLRKNGIDTGLALALVAGDSAKSEVVTEVAFAAGDLVSFGIVSTGGDHSYNCTGICFIPDDPRMWFLCRPYGVNGMTGSGFSFPNLADVNVGDAWAAAESSGGIALWGPFPHGVMITGVALKLAVAPGAGQWRSITLRKNQVDTAITVLVSNAATFGLASVALVEPVDFEMFSVSDARSGAGVAASRGSFSIFGATSTVTVTAVVPASAERGTP